MFGDATGPRTMLPLTSRFIEFWPPGAECTNAWPPAPCWCRVGASRLSAATFWPVSATDFDISGSASAASKASAHAYGTPAAAGGHGSIAWFCATGGIAGFGG